MSNSADRQGQNGQWAASLDGPLMQSVRAIYARESAAMQNVCKEIDRGGKHLQGFIGCEERDLQDRIGTLLVAIHRIRNQLLFVPPGDPERENLELAYETAMSGCCVMQAALLFRDLRAKRAV